MELLLSKQRYGMTLQRYSPGYASIGDLGDRITTFGLTTHSNAAAFSV